MVWNFMCAYHGKGPYDAEGGLIKYYVRRAMKFRGIAFTSAGDVVTWLKGSGEVRRGSAQVKNARSRGTFHQMRQFTISERFFHHVEEADVVGLQKGSFCVLCVCRVWLERWRLHIIETNHRHDHRHHHTFSQPRFFFH